MLDADERKQLAMQEKKLDGPSDKNILKNCDNNKLIEKGINEKLVESLSILNTKQKSNFYNSKNSGHAVKYFPN